MQKIPQQANTRAHRQRNLHRLFAAFMWTPEDLHVFLEVRCLKEHDVVAFVGT